MWTNFCCMQEGDNLTKEQIENEIKKIREAHAEDEGNLLFLVWKIVFLCQLLFSHFVPAGFDSYYS